MIRRIRSIFACLALFATLAIGGGSPAPASDVTPTLDAVSATEVRLRKLHLVRPDLIPYPIAYEVCC